MSDDVPVEFVGGPVDGKSKIYPADVNDEIDVQELKHIGCEDIEIIHHLYVRRRINGIAVRLPSGFFPYDWQSSRC
jgi:hypothetical protein